jgi:dipeptidyl aminopeptidase/acylaminoacyl peptidase
LRYWSGSQFWLWSEKQGEVETFSLGDSSERLNLSPDNQYIAFTRQTQVDGAVELWIADIDGSNQRLLTTVSPADLLARYPNAVSADFYYKWISGTEKLLLAYRFHPIFDALGDVPAEPQTIIDVDTGESWILEPLSDVYASTRSPNGQQTAVLVDGIVQLLDTTDGRVLFTIPVTADNTSDQTFQYSPDGNILIFFEKNGITLINPADGSNKEIPLTYEPIGLGHYRVTPPIYWIQNGPAFYTIVTDNQNVFEPEATFSLWRIESTSGEALLVHTFNGSILSADLSPDQQLLAFWLQDVNDRSLFLADVASGEQIEYVRGPLVDFLGWNPDGQHFHYWLPDERKPILGHPCEAPIAFADLGFPEIADNIRWIDANRFLFIGGHRNEGGESGTWTLYLNSLNGQSQVVGTVEGEIPQVLFYFE